MSTPRAPELRSRFATASDFAELISQEVSVDIDRLKFLAFHGIPDERGDQTLRGDVWKVLIPNLYSAFAASASLDHEETVPSASPETAKWIRDALDMYQPEEPFFRRPTIRSRMEKVCVQYFLDHPSSVAGRDPKMLIHLFAPFAYTSKKGTSEELFFMFMEMLERHNTFEVKEKSFRRFMSLFRSQIPKLCAHFEDEEVDSRKWVSYGTSINHSRMGNTNVTLRKNKIDRFYHGMNVYLLVSFPSDAYSDYGTHTLQ
jgi:hypothetical protein